MTGLALAAGLLAATPAGGTPPQEPWADHKFSVQELKADRELAALHERISRGEFPRIEFDPGSAALRPEAFRVLDLVADVLIENPHARVIISGHACLPGGEARTQELSERRAKTVQAYLVKQGVPPSVLRVRGWGTARPAADNSTEEGRRLNRRVEFRVIQGTWGSFY